MNMGMAVGATTVEVLDGTEGLGLGRMAAAVMAVVANAWHANFQQLRVVAAVRFVAVGAVFEYRRMLPQKRAAAFRVAAQTVFVGAALDELLRVGRAVRIVATGAGHFPFAIGHVRGALQLRAAHLVAGEAQFGLGFLHAPVFSQG